MYQNLTFRRVKGKPLSEDYEYTKEGLLKSATQSGMRYSYNYDVMGRLTSKKASGKTLLSFEYDKNGNKIKEVDVTGKIVNYTYNELDLLVNIGDNKSSIANYEYNEDRTIKRLSHGSLEKVYNYDLDKNLVGLQVGHNKELIVNNRYEYNKNGDRTRKEGIGGVTTYDYGKTRELKEVNYPTYKEELFYDKRGNRTRRIKNNVEEIYNYDPRNRLVSLTKNQEQLSFEYDNQGNLVKDNKAIYEYNDFNQRVKVETFDGNVQINRYDPEGLRYELEENGKLIQFIYNLQKEVVAEKESTWTTYIRGSELLTRSSDYAKTYYHYASDEMSSITHIVDDEKILNYYEYDAWGEVTKAIEEVENRFKFNGQMLDPLTNQYYLRARYYNPVIARFTQEDTYRGDGLNLYAYCQNNPVSYVDPTGHLTQCQKDAYNEAPLCGTNLPECFISFGAFVPSFIQ